MNFTRIFSYFFTRMYPYVSRMCPYVSRMYPYVTRMLVVCYSYVSVCFVCYSYVTRMLPYVLVWCFSHDLQSLAILSAGIFERLVHSAHF